MKLSATKFSCSQKKDDLFSTLTSTQKEFDAYKISCKVKFSLIDKDEISMLKNKINSLGEVLKKCEFDKADWRLYFLRNISQRIKLMLHTPILINHNMCTHIMLNTQHKPNMFTLHTLIMPSFMVKFMRVLIVAEKVTWLNFVLIE